MCSCTWHHQFWTAKDYEMCDSFLSLSKKCGISNSLDGPEDDTLFEESESSDNISLILGRNVVMRILWDSVTSRNHILPCNFVESVFVNWASNIYKIYIFFLYLTSNLGASYNLENMVLCQTVGSSINRLVLTG